MERRTALRVIALGALSSKIAMAKGAPDCMAHAGAAWAPSDYKLQFFTEGENQLADQLMELIIPADSHSPGAHAAQVSLFADRMVAESDESTQGQWRGGLRLMQMEAKRSSLAQVLALAAAQEGHPVSELERFFVALKRMTVNGYYTSEIGIHQDLEYQGNTYVSEFPENA